MKQIVFISLLIFNLTASFGQYTEIINSKRPGFSESPYSVGTDVLQVEAGLFYQDNQINKTFDTDNSFGTNFFVRYGKFLENLEINLEISFQNDNRVFNNIITSRRYTVAGISKLTFGAKYLIYNQKFTDKSKEIRSWKKRTAFDKKRLIPSVGVFVGVNTNFLGEAFKDEGLSPKVAILLQNDITNRFVVLTNLVADKIGQNNSEFGYILTATYALNQKWSVFGEQQTVLKKVTSNEFQLGTGTAFLYTNNMQFDFSTRVNFVGDAVNFYFGLGGSWRLDKHKKYTTKQEEDGVKTKKGGSAFSKLFKKSKRKKPKTRKIKARKRKKEKTKKGTPSFHKKDTKKQGN